MTVVTKLFLNNSGLLQDSSKASKWQSNLNMVILLGRPLYTEAQVCVGWTSSLAFRLYHAAQSSRAAEEPQPAHGQQGATCSSSAASSSPANNVHEYILKKRIK